MWGIRAALCVLTTCLGAQETGVTWNAKLLEVNRLVAKGQAGEAEKTLLAAIAQAQQREADGRLAAALNHNLAILYVAMDRREDAGYRFRQALSVWQRFESTNRGELACTANELALNYMVQHRLSLAAALINGPVGRQVEALGPRHIEAIRWENRRGDVLFLEGKLDEAEPVFQKVVAALESGPHARDPELVAALNDLGVIYRRTGRMDAAIASFAHAQRLADANQPSTDPERLKPYLNLAEAYVSAQRYPEADTAYRSILQDAETNFGLVHPVRAEALAQYAAGLRRMKRAGEAKKLEKDAKAILAKTTPPSSAHHTVDVSELHQTN